MLLNPIKRKARSAARTCSDSRTAIRQDIRTHHFPKKITLSTFKDQKSLTLQPGLQIPTNGGFKKPERCGAFGAAACVIKPDKAKSPERSEDLQR